MKEYIAFYGLYNSESDTIPEAITQFKAPNDKRALEIARNEEEKEETWDGKFSLIRLLKIEEILI
jgi:hypothetical protein